MKVVALTGGVGGAKLVLGLIHHLPPQDVTAIVNTGDDFVHMGLSVSPDIDTLLYTLSGKANQTLGWGREGETWSFMAAAKALGGPGWFNLGDGDLALHVLRTERLRAGATLSMVVADFAKAWSIDARVLPMTDDPVATRLETDEGPMDFQPYFVGRRCEPKVGAIRFDGAAEARPGPGVAEAIMGADAVIIAPSNPFLSVDPLLAVPGIRAALEATAAPIVAVSPLVGGTAVKGPTAKLMAELGIDISAEAVALHYGGLIDAMLVDERDPPTSLTVVEARADTLMKTLADKVRVAEAALALAARVRG